jgi:hypothetical protein
MSPRVMYVPKALPYTDGYDTYVNTAPVVAHIYASVGIHRRIAPVLAGIYASVTIYIHVLGRKNQWNAQSSLGRHKNETYVVRMYSNVCPYIDT